MSSDIQGGEGGAGAYILTKKPRTRAFVIHADLPQWVHKRGAQKIPRKDLMRSTASCLDEALGLAHALDLAVEGSRVIKLQ